MQETGGKDAKKLKELKEEYHQVESHFEDLLIKFRLENPLYASVNYPPVTVRDLQKDVLKKGEILISFFISTEKVYAFIGFGDPVYDYENFKQGLTEQGSMKILATENSSLTHSPYSPYSPNSPEDEIKGIHRDRYTRAGGIMDRLPYSREEI